MAAPATTAGPAEAPPSPANPQVDYSTLTPFSAARFVIEVCHKLQCNVITTATAMTYFHTFYDKASMEQYDPVSIGATCILLASKTSDEDVRIRDIINVTAACLAPHQGPLALEEYFSRRDSLTQCELLLMRALGFRLQPSLPHRYLLLLLQALRDWVGREAWDRLPTSKVAWRVLQDAYHSPLVIKAGPEVVAAAAAHVAAEVTGAAVPREDAAWCAVLGDHAPQAVTALATQLLALYEQDSCLVLLAEGD